MNRYLVIGGYRNEIEIHNLRIIFFRFKQLDLELFHLKESLRRNKTVFYIEYLN